MDTIQVGGMSCQHCVGAVSKALAEIEGLSEVSVDLDSGTVNFVNSGVDREIIRSAISKIGFDPEQ